MLTTNKKNHFFSSINKRVFLSSVTIITTLLLLIILFPDATSHTFKNIQDNIITRFGWLYLLSVIISIIFCFLIAFSEYGKIKLGSDDSEPEYSYIAWFAMLFSAGMGIGILFFGVAEPVVHYTAPPQGEANTIEAAKQAMVLTFFHWGIHAWAIYALIGMALAYFGFRHNLPFSIRSTLYPILGKRIHGVIGDIIDILALVATVIGLATSLGLGVLQITQGLNYLFGLTANFTTQVITVIGITLIASLSIFSGLNAGVKRLSVINLCLVLILLIYVFFAGPSLKLLRFFVENTGNYLNNIIYNSFNMFAYQTNNDWLATWTLFYWGWWISWSPFVGMFIARVSKGRTIRAFLLGVLFLPVGFTFIWMTVFGNTALFYEQLIPDTLSGSVAQQIEMATFKLYEHLPFSSIASLLTIIVSAIFFITSVDSGCIVLEMITSKGKLTAIWYHGIFWAVLIALVTICLLFAGGLQALQTAALTSALPFLFVILAVCYSVLKSLNAETFEKIQKETVVFHGAKDHVLRSWQSMLKSMFTYPNKKQAKAFLEKIVIPAFEVISKEFEKKGIKTIINHQTTNSAIEIKLHNIQNFRYSIQLKTRLIPGFILSNTTIARNKVQHYYTADVSLINNESHHNAYGYNREELIQDVFYQYEKYIDFLHLNDTL